MLCRPFGDLTLACLAMLCSGTLAVFGYAMCPLVTLAVIGYVM